MISALIIVKRAKTYILDKMINLPSIIWTVLIIWNVVIKILWKQFSAKNKLKKKCYTLQKSFGPFSSPIPRGKLQALTRIESGWNTYYPHKRSCNPKISTRGDFGCQQSTWTPIRLTLRAWKRNPSTYTRQRCSIQTVLSGYK